MRFRAPTPKPAWIEGIVDPKREHASLCYGERRQIMARVTPHRREGFIVQFLLKAPPGAPQARMLDEVRRELTFYLLDVVGPDSWAFVQYHCDSPANHLSRVHWSWHPEAERPSRPSRTRLAAR